MQHIGWRFDKAIMAIRIDNRHLFRQDDILPHQMSTPSLFPNRQSTHSLAPFLFWSHYHYSQINGLPGNDLGVDIGSAHALQRSNIRVQTGLQSGLLQQVEEPTNLIQGTLSEGQNSELVIFSSWTQEQWNS